MLALHDERWATLEGGCREPVDARDWLRRFHAGDVDDALWEEVWLNLYHQEDVGEASYAVVPHLVAAHADRPRGAMLYGYCEAVEAARGLPGNPPLPPWLRESYPAALDRLAGWGAADLPALDRVGRVKVMALLARRAGMDELAGLLDWSLGHERFGDALISFAGEVRRAEAGA